MSNWKEKDYEESRHEYIDACYYQAFDGIVNITRSDRDVEKTPEKLLLDKEACIDTYIEFESGVSVTLQEKSRKYRWYRYHDFTFEYYNDPENREPGQWHKIKSDMFFYGWANSSDTDYAKFYILNVLYLKAHLINKIGIEKLKRHYLRYNKPPCKSNFFAIPFKLIKQIETPERKIILYESGGRQLKIPLNYWVDYNTQYKIL